MNSDIMNLTDTRRHRFAACFIAGLVVCTAAVVLPFARMAALHIPAFMPMFATAVFGTEGLTAYLLWTQFVIARRPFLAALSGAYLFTAMTVGIQILVFPGVFSPTGLLGAGPQTAIWIWVAWHGGFPVLILTALMIYRAYPHVLQSDADMRRLGVLLIGMPFCVSVVTSYLAVHASTMLPALLHGDSYSQLIRSPAGIAVTALNVAAIVRLVVVTRLRKPLYVWLAVALLAALADVVLTLVASARFSYGWYAARVDSVMASSAVLGVLIWEITHLYRALNTANRRLQEFALLDGLTGIFNRRLFDERYHRELDRALTYACPMSVLLIDIDYFKRFNDLLGHLRGDECLIAVAGTLKDNLRRSQDFVARYGGEEFAVVLPDCNDRAATQIAESLRGAIEALGIDAPFTDAGRLTVSIGIATLAMQDRPSPSAHALLARADAALYRAKSAGRNQVAHGEPEWAPAA